MLVVTKEKEIMEKKNIQEYTDFYATFMRIKKSEPRQDYIVVLPEGKEKSESHGKDGTIYN
jgi:hypothetical protein